ncbi:MAG TPA: winged helix DNA-binding domain-containing protein [Stackebrandtia sp.]|jgi:hypothetical protein|uniref:winged helix DNA-binding domain-containing protein n=1 Tax=Stackebrandtia sp. TaxID=2023065 RepID=UPI002D746DE6|nr:winged helix DNA-binding domain-containing protein [Stackebrandtia sp.]HZE37821.1 winged helix DNA-binding domain-containing protein [Stackebrandtia sp.]
MAAPLLSPRALNRARLRRQWLTERRPATALEAMEHVVGMQAQQGDAPYYQLWSRLRDFVTDDLSRLLTGRLAVRVVLMRGTIHLVSAADCRRLRPVIQPFLDKILFSGSQQGRRLTGVDTAKLVAVGEELLASEPLHVNDLAARLGERIAGFGGDDLAYGLKCAMPLLQVPPRGVWGRGGGLVYASPRQWLGTPEAPSHLDETVRRYLAAFGPAGVADFQAWSSLTRTAEAFDRLDLRRYRDADGRELFDLPDAPPPDADAPVRPTLLGPFDNILLSHADRGFIVPERHRGGVFTKNGLIPGTVLIDGMVAGAWKTKLAKKKATIHLELFEPAGPSEREAVAAEAEALLEFAAPAATERHVELAEA